MFNVIEFRPFHKLFTRQQQSSLIKKYIQKRSGSSVQMSLSRSKLLLRSNESVNLRIVQHHFCVRNQSTFVQELNWVILSANYIIVCLLPAFVRGKSPLSESLLFYCTTIYSIKRLSQSFLYEKNLLYFTSSFFYYLI